MRNPSARITARMKPAKSGPVTPADLWSGFQERFFALATIGVGLTLTYIAILVLPRLGSLNGSPVIPGWDFVNGAILNIHILTAIPPLVLGLLAFSSRARRWSLRVHRWIGTVYCVCIWISALTGGLLAIANEHGLGAKLGFGFLAIAWFTTTYFAYTTARRKDLINHRRWMIRSFALTLAVVSVRPMFLFGPPAGMDPANWYVLVTWICWVPNLMIGELYARATMYSGRLTTLSGRRPGGSAPTGKANASVTA